MFQNNKNKTDQKVSFIFNAGKHGFTPSPFSTCKQVGLRGINFSSMFQNNKNKTDQKVSFIFNAGKHGFEP